MLKEMIDANETILWEGKPNLLIYVLGNLFIYPFAALWAVFDLFILAKGFGFRLDFSLFLLFHMAPVWYAIFSPVYRFFNWFRIKYALTNKRIYFTSGIIGLDISSLELPEVQGLTVNVGVLETLLKCGTVNFTDGRLLSIKQPYEVYKLIQRTALDITSDIQFPNEFRPKENPGYHTEYKPK